MQFSNKKRLKGITLVELIIVLAISGVLIALSSNSILMLFKTHSMASSEYDLHSASRLASEKVSETIRYSQAVFAIPFDYVKNINSMDPEWDYIAISNDGKELVEYTYDSVTGKHISKVLIPSQPNVEYEINFDKKSAKQVTVDGHIQIIDDNILFYSVTAFLLKTDGSGNTIRTEKKVVFESEVKALNAIQVVDKGTQTSPAVALAFRKDDKTYGEGRSHVVKIALILDVSGSMQWIPGYDRNPTSTEKSRLTLLKEALIGSGLDGNSGIIAQFAPFKNFEITLVPFSQRAEYISNPATSKPFFNAYLGKNDLVDEIKNLRSGGSTNTGDGIRLSFYNMKDFDTSGYGTNIEQHDFTIILVDGDSNEYSWVTRSGSRYYHRWEDTTYNVDGSYTNGFTYVTRLGETIRNDFSYKGDYYLIGYVTNPNSSGVKNIKEALAIPENQVFLYNDSSFNLSEVFSNIATEIMAKTWLVTGPKVMN